MIVDHLALIYVIKSKAELETTRIKRLLELVSSYSFNLYYMKGKDMILSDFLYRQKHDDSDPHEIIPISFNMYNALHEIYYRIEPQDHIFSADAITDKRNRYNVTRSAWSKENIRHKGITRKTESLDTS